MQTVLLVDDDDSLAETVQAGLGRTRYHVSSSATGADARALIPLLRPDLIVLDLLLPDTDGLVLIPQLRALTLAPILILSARSGQVDRVLSLRLGADDYMAKPFDLDELEARVHALLRSVVTPTLLPAPGVIVAGELSIGLLSHVTTLHGQQVNLTPIEHKLLVALASQPGVLLSRSELAAILWPDEDASANTHGIDVHVGRLRGKLRRAWPGTSEIIQTARGHGYSLGY